MIASGRPAISTFERYLSVWVALCIVAGIALGAAIPGAFAAIAAAEVAHVNLPVALLIWLMIIPMLLKIDFGALGQVRQHLRGVGVTLFINWAVKPFSMALLGTVFIGWLFRPLLPDGQIDSYIAGLILLAAAPCTAMVFVWSNLCEGEPHYTLSQVALNDVIMVFAFAPPAMPELGTSAGFVFYLKDNAGLGHEALVAARNQFLGAAMQNPLLANVRPSSTSSKTTGRYRSSIA